MARNQIQLNPQANLAQDITYSGNITYSSAWVNGAFPAPITLASASPTLIFSETDQASGEKNWALTLNSKHLQLFTLSDTGSFQRTFLDLLAGTGGNATSLTFGNSTDNPSILFPGSGQITTGGPLVTYQGVTATTASGVAVTLKALPSSTGLGYATYMVTATLAGVSDPTNYNAVAIISLNNSTGKSNTIVGANLMSISLSGLNVQATQSSGGSQPITYSIVRLA